MQRYTHPTARGEVGIRPTRESDAEAYRALRLAALRAHPEAFGADYAQSAAQPPAYWQERMRRGAGGEHGVSYVAEATGALVGITGLVRHHDEPKARHAGLIVSVYVAPEWRGAGVASALLEACLAWARQLELRLVRLAVATSNTPAIRTYLRHGFTVYGVEPEAIGYGGQYYDELLMVKRL